MAAADGIRDKPMGGHGQIFSGEKKGCGAETKIGTNVLQ